MAKIQKMTPEERERQLANQRRIDAHIARRLAAEQRERPRDLQPPHAEKS